jgi:hypothetical protein
VDDIVTAQAERELEWILRKTSFIQHSSGEGTVWCKGLLDAELLSWIIRILFFFKFCLAECYNYIAACQKYKSTVLNPVTHTHICSLRKSPKLCSHLYHVFPAPLTLALLLGFFVVNHIITSHTAVLESGWQVDLQLTSLPIKKNSMAKVPFF